MYNLSGIQKGIQSLHATVEYSNCYGQDKNYLQWSNVDKTVIILDGGSSGDMLKLAEKLWGYDIKHANFYEPDLNNAMSAIAFLVGENVYNFDIEKYELGHPMYGEREFQFSEFLKGFRLASN
jgi:hypothetical protein